MTRSRRMQPVVNYSKSVEQDAARILAQSQRALDAARQRMDDLIRYKQEYLQQFERACRSGAQAARMQDFRAFLVKLDGAIGQQSRHIDVLRREQETRRSQWLDSHRRHQALGKVTERYRSQELVEEQVREQKQSDEIVCHAYTRATKKP